MSNRRMLSPLTPTLSPDYRGEGGLTRPGTEFMHETFEHTADLGLRIRAADLDTLFVEAAQFVCSRPSSKISRRCGGLPEESTCCFPGRRRKSISCSSIGCANFSTILTPSICCSANSWSTSTEGGLTASAWGEPLDRARHNLEHEVKAITYHGLRVERVGAEWEAEVIVDI